MERIFDTKDYSDEKAFKIASLKLTKVASLWFENVKAQWAKEGRIKITSWTRLKQLMNRRFLPSTHKQDIMRKLFAFMQGKRSVSDYIQEFEQLFIKSDL